MLFRVLGPVQVDTGDGVRVPSGPRARALLTALLTQPGEVVPVHRPAEALWGRSALLAGPPHRSCGAEALAELGAVAG